MNKERVYNMLTEICDEMVHQKQLANYDIICDNDVINVYLSPIRSVEHITLNFKVGDKE